MSKQQIGVIGLAVMGKNLALNIESRGFTVSVFNRSPEKTHDLLDNEAKGKNLVGTFSVEEFVNSLETPRKILIMVQAGPATDSTIEQLLPYLDQGDIIIDGVTHTSRIRSAAAKNWKLKDSALSVQGYLAVKKAP